MEHCASGMDSENRIVVGKPDVSQGRKARSFLLLFPASRRWFGCNSFPREGVAVAVFFLCLWLFQAIEGKENNDS